MRNVSAVVLAVMLSCSVSLAMADGFYVEGRGGLTLFTDTESTDGGPDPLTGFPSSTLDFNFDKGPVGAVLFGYEFESGFRVELDFGYRRAGVGRVDIIDAGGREVVFGLPSIAGPASDVGVEFEGEAEAFSGLVNVLYGFDLAPLSPFIGGGIGVAHVRGDIIETGHTGIVAKYAVGSDTVFAYQAIAGVALAVDDALSVTLSYSYFDTLDPQLKKRPRRPMSVTSTFPATVSWLDCAGRSRNLAGVPRRDDRLRGRSFAGGRPRLAVEKFLLGSSIGFFDGRSSSL